MPAKGKNKATSPKMLKTAEKAIRGKKITIKEKKGLGASLIAQGRGKKPKPKKS